MMAGAGASPYELASDAASRLGIAVGAEELATLASDLDLGDGEMAAVAAQPHRTAQSLPVLRGPVKAEGRGCRHRVPFSSYLFGHASRAPARR